MKKILKIIAKVIGGIVGGAVALFLLAWIGLAIGKYFIYWDYYKIRSKEARNPGLNNGYVSQGCTYNDDEAYYVTAGYMADDTVSRLYKIDKKNKKITYYTMTSGGKDFYGHTGGLQYTGGYFYLANESDGVYKFSASLLGDNKTVEIGSPIMVNNHSSYIFSDDKYIYVGEYNDDNNYPCTNEIVYNGKIHRAIVTKYAVNDLSKPLEIYSVENNMQGFAVTPAGNIVLSRSYALYSSNFYVYTPESLIDTGKTMDGAKVWFLDKENARDIKAPPMSEDLDYKDGKIIYMAEFACNKYIVGKLFFDYFIYGLRLE